jgi:Stabilization of polarity axis
MIIAFYVNTNSGLSLISRIIETDVQIQDQLLSGMLSALDSLSAEIMGSNMKTFMTGEITFYINQITPDLRCVFATKDTNALVVAGVYKKIVEALKKTDFFNISRDTLVADSNPIITLIDGIIATANLEFEHTIMQKDSIKKIGSLKYIFEKFKTLSILLWRGILLGNRIIVTGSDDEEIKKCVLSLPLLFPNDTRYHCYPLIEMKKINTFNSIGEYIVGLNTPFISTIPRDLWDVHVQISRSTIIMPDKTMLDKGEEKLFQDLFASSTEEEYREAINGLNMRFLVYLERFFSSKGNVKSILKETGMSKTYYSDFIIKILEQPDSSYKELLLPEAKVRNNIIEDITIQSSGKDNISPTNSSISEASITNNENIINRHQSQDDLEFVDSIDADNEIIKQLTDRGISINECNNIVRDLRKIMQSQHFTAEETQKVFSPKIHLESVSLFKKRNLIIESQIEKVSAVKFDVLSRANGLCELCGVEAFLGKDGESKFLLLHNLGEIGGYKTKKEEIANMAAICPNCHTKIHYGIVGICYNEILLINVQKK